MKTQYTVMTLLLFISLNASALTGLNTNQAREVIGGLKTDYQGQCQNLNKQVNRTLNYLFSFKSLSQQEKSSCRQAVYEEAVVLCRLRTKMISELENLLTDETIQLIGSRIDANPPPDAVGAVILWKMEKVVKKMSTDTNSWLNLKARKSNCSIVTENVGNALLNIPKESNGLIKSLNEISFTSATSNSISNVDSPANGATLSRTQGPVGGAN